MLFNSLHFLLFFPVVTAIYFWLPHRYRWGLLLIASCYFYLVFIPAYLLILFFLVIVDYVAGIVIEGAQGRRRKIYLISSLVANLGVLVLFKYYNFLNDNLAAFFGFFQSSYPLPHLNIILPIGLSFHTFQSMSYTIEVYRGRQRAERHLGIYALYVLFYPQLVAGPIERPYNLLHQFYQPQRFDYQRVMSGLRLMLWGLFKKVVIADRLALLVDTIYNDPTQHTGLALIVATYFFAFQVYCDFSGYSDIAIGAAQVMGFKLMENFRRPFFAKSTSELWKRWHISLSTWFRDYVYIPLGGSQGTIWRHSFNIFFVFLLSGLWHGANWTFIIWGALQGCYLVGSLWTRPLRERVVAFVGLGRYPTLHKCVQVLITFHLFVFALIFFRANSLSDASYIVTHLFSGLGGVLEQGTSRLLAEMATWGLGLFDLLVALLAIALLEAIHLWQRRHQIGQLVAESPGWARWAVYYAAVLAIVFFGKFDAQQFVYFQF